MANIHFKWEDLIPATTCLTRPLKCNRVWKAISSHHCRMVNIVQPCPFGNSQFIANYHWVSLKLGNSHIIVNILVPHQNLFNKDEKDHKFKTTQKSFKPRCCFRDMCSVLYVKESNVGRKLNAAAMMEWSKRARMKVTTQSQGYSRPWVYKRQSIAKDSKVEIVGTCRIQLRFVQF